MPPSGKHRFCLILHPITKRSAFKHVATKTHQLFFDLFTHQKYLISALPWDVPAIPKFITREFHFDIVENRRKWIVSKRSMIPS
jgi:hypothetical protein